MTKTNETKRVETIRKKLNFYKDENLAVHIKKKNGWFHNGTISKIRSDFIILDDEKEGDMPIFFSEIFEIEKRKPKKEVKGE